MKWRGSGFDKPIVLARSLLSFVIRILESNKRHGFRSFRNLAACRIDLLNRCSKVNRDVL
jgi:hypothetical protein